MNEHIFFLYDIFIDDTDIEYFASNIVFESSRRNDIQCGKHWQEMWHTNLGQRCRHQPAVSAPCQRLHLQTWCPAGRWWFLWLYDFFTAEKFAVKLKNPNLTETNFFFLLWSVPLWKFWPQIFICLLLERSVLCYGNGYIFQVNKELESFTVNNASF